MLLIAARKRRNSEELTERYNFNFTPVSPFFFFFFFFLESWNKYEVSVNRLQYFSALLKNLNGIEERFGFISTDN